MATSDVYSCTYNYLERSESLPDHDGIFPINFDVVKCCSTRREDLCKSVGDILKDPIFSNEVLHNVKSIKRTYTNAGVAQAMLSNFEPSYRSQSKMRHREVSNQKQDIARYTNWCFSIKFDDMPVKARTNNIEKSGSKRKLFENLKLTSWKTKRNSLDEVDEDKESQILEDSNFTDGHMRVRIPDPDQARQNEPRRASAA